MSLARFQNQNNEPELDRFGRTLGWSFAVANTASESVIRTEPAASAAERPNSSFRWPKRLLVLLIFLWLADSGISLLIQHTRLRRELTSRLAISLGRPVDVRRYAFSLWGGPTLEGQSFEVGDDPRFGHEYFLRADSLTIRLRWQSLLRGRIEPGRVRLVHPSLNLVRSAEGDWNLVEWFPRPSEVSTNVAPAGPSQPASSPLRFTRVEVDSGRINFKRADEKLPFALVGVSGFAEPESPGRWRMDLEATPTRAAVVVQQAGTLHLSGHVGGTSSRLRPAILDLSWTDASLPDVLRLARGYDFGIRGTLALLVNARTDQDVWTLSGRTELRQVHRWDLPLRADNPALNLIAKMRWYPLASALQLDEATLEAPHSNSHAKGSISWEEPTGWKGEQSLPVNVHVHSSVIDLGDLLAWFRAFHAGVADGVGIHGVVEAQGTIGGWPLRVINARVSGEGADLTGPPLRIPVHLGEIESHYDHGLDFVDPLTLSFGASDGSLRLDAFRKPRANGLAGLRLTGNLKQVRDLISTAGALGWNISRGWDLAGPLRCDLRWQGEQFPWRAQPTGMIDWGAGPDGGSLLTSFLNLPIEQIRAHADWKPGARHITVTSAQAFGAHWSGTLDRIDPEHEWRFALEADRLLAADLDRWLNPRRRQGFLDRMLPFLNPSSSSNAVPETLRASGRVALGQFTLAPLILHRLQGDLKIEGRHFALAHANAQFYGGEISGSLDAKLEAAPAYRVGFDFSHVDLSALSAASPGLANLFAGSATGQVFLSARGGSRADLLASLECQGIARMKDAGLRGIDLLESVRKRTRQPGTSSFREASSTFSCADGKVRFPDLVLLGPDATIEGSGSVDFGRTLDFRLRVPSTVVTPRIARASDALEEAFQLSGPLVAPKITRISNPARRP
jgi:uncharacterized protein involved in outer membrane biogenesis